MYKSVLDNVLNNVQPCITTLHTLPFKKFLEFLKIMTPKKHHYVDSFYRMEKGQVNILILTKSTKSTFFDLFDKNKFISNYTLY